MPRIRIISALIIGLSLTTPVLAQTTQGNTMPPNPTQAQGDQHPWAHHDERRDESRDERRAARREERREARREERREEHREARRDERQGNHPVPPNNQQANAAPVGTSPALAPLH